MFLLLVSHGCCFNLSILHMVSDISRFFLLFSDEGVHWGIQNGLHLSRSTIVYFKHNNMDSLQNILEKVTQDNKRAKKLRRYIVAEAMYQVQSTLVFHC